MAPTYIPNSLAKKPLSVRQSLGPVDRSMANVETEGGETVFLPDKEGLPAHYRIHGPRHHEGGVPMNIPPDSFVFSDTASMRIKDPDIQKEFGMPEKKKGYTPAEIAKKYDINAYRQILADPAEDKLAKLTAENMIKMYNLKLGKLALIQESLKGYPSGIPIIATPYLMSVGMRPEDVLPELPMEAQQQSPQEEMMEAPEDQSMQEEYMEEPMEPMMRNGGRTARLNNFIQGIRKKNNEFDPTQGLYMYMEEGGPVFYDANGIPAPDGVMPDEFRNGGLVQYADGAEVKKKKQRKPDANAVVINKADYKTDAEYLEAKKKAYESAKDKNKVFVLDTDGTYKRIVSKAFVYPDYTGEDLDKTFNGNKDIAARYEYIKQRLNDPTVLAKLHEQYLKTFDDKKAFSRNGSLKARKVEIEALKKLTPEQVRDQLLEMQKRNLALKAHGKDVASTPNAPKTGDVTSDTLREWAGTIGVDMPDATSAAAQQAAYWAFEELAGTVLPEFNKGQIGAEDEKGSKSTKISPVDAVYTNTTAGQLINAKGDPTLAEDVYDVYEDETTEGIDDPKDKPEAPPYTAPEMFLQDAMGLAHLAGASARLRKFMPNKFSVDLMTPDPAYLTPERNIAAINEQLAIGKDALAASSPQQVAGKFSGISGEAFAKTADVIGQTHNSNIGIYNQFEQVRAATNNQETLQNATLAKSYFDELTNVNQQYANSKAAVLDQFTNNMRQAETNKEMAYNLNQLYPNYQISPAMGGRMYYKKATPMKPSESQTFMDIYASLRKDGRLQGLGDDDIKDIALQMSGYSKSGAKAKSTSTEAQDWYNTQRGMFGNVNTTSYPNLDEEEG